MLNIINLQLTRILNPKENIEFNEAFTACKPQPVQNMKLRNINPTSVHLTLAKMSAFSMGVVDMLKLTKTKKMALLQELVMEDRFMELKDALVRSIDSCENDIMKNGMMTKEQLVQLHYEVARGDLNFALSMSITSEQGAFGAETLDSDRNIDLNNANKTNSLL